MRLPSPPLVLALILPFASACKKEAPEKEAASKGYGPYDYGGDYVCEEHWLLSLVARDLDRARARIEGSDPDAGRSLEALPDESYRLDGIGGIVPSPSPWHLATWDKLVEGIQPPGQAPNPESILIQLLQSDTATIEELNAAVSARLSESPDHPGLHEQAALLLGTWGLTEEAGYFTDLRQLLCRMTAHLALARQLRGDGEPTLDGRWAVLLFDYHRGLRVDAWKKLTVLREAGESPRPWCRAMDAFIRGDWRTLDGNRSISLLEAMAQCRALRFHHSPEAALALAEEHEALGSHPYWCRSLLAKRPSVEHGHLCREFALPLEFQQIDEVFPIDPDGDFLEDLPASLNAESPDSMVTAGGELAVISPGDWGAYFRRHLFLELYRLNDHMLNQWGVPEAAEEWRVELEPLFSKLTGYDTCAPLFTTRREDFVEKGKKVREAITADPRQVTGCVWSLYRNDLLDWNVRVGIPPEPPWFRTSMPPGTAYNANHRTYCRVSFGDAWGEMVRDAFEKDPWNHEVAYQLVAEMGSNPEVIRKAYSKLEDYSIRALRARRNAEPAGSDEHIEVLGRMAGVDPEYGLELGLWQALRGEDEAAARALELAFEEAGDRVAVANRTRWLIHHHLSHGNAARAREVADHNAEVYSHAGLLSALVLAMHERDEARAAELATALHERYGNKLYPVIVAAHFGGAGSPPMQQVFPEGRREATLDQLRDEGATRGLRITGDSEIIGYLPVEENDVILAVDGVRVENYPQYILLVDTTLDPGHRLIIRRGVATEDSGKPEYHEFDLVLPHGRMGCGLDAVE